MNLSTKKVFSIFVLATLLPSLSLALPFGFKCQTEKNAIVGEAETEWDFDAALTKLYVLHEGSRLDFDLENFDSRFYFSDAPFHFSFDAYVYNKAGEKVASVFGSNKNEVLKVGKFFVDLASSLEIDGSPAECDFYQAGLPAELK